MLDRFQRTPLLSDWVPVEDYLGDRALLLSDGSVHAAFEAEGRPAETADALARMRWHDALNAALRNLCSDRLALKVKLCRGYADPAAWPRLECDIPFVEDLVHGYRDRLRDRALDAKRLFVTLEYRPARPAGEWIGGKLEAAHRQAAAAAPRASETTQERLDHLERACDLLATALADHGLRRLGLKTTDMANAQAPTIRTKLLKIGAQIRITARKVWVSLSSAYPWQPLFQQVWLQLRT